MAPKHPPEQKHPLKGSQLESSKHYLFLDDEPKKLEVASVSDSVVEVDGSYTVYASRWIMLVLFVTFSASNGMQWTQYTIISDIVTGYYGVSSNVVSWTSMVYMITYVPLIFPASWLLDKTVQQLEQRNCEQNKQIITLEQKVELLEKNTRTSTVEIRNIPTASNENRQSLISIVEKIASTIKMLPALQNSDPNLTIISMAEKNLEISGSVMDGVSEKGGVESPGTKLPIEYTVYRVRWLVLFIFVIYSASNGMQWVQYSIIQDTVVKYYGVTSLTVYWTSMVYMITYIPLIFPASFLLDKTLGVALGFLLPPMIVRAQGTTDEIRSDLQLMFYLIAGLTSVLFVLIVLFFKAAPSTPPSAAADLGSELDSNFLQSLKKLMTNRNYVLLLISYGLNVGVFYAISTLLNELVLTYYPGANTDAGRIGLVLVVAGMVGSVVCGLILDKTHRFKETTLAVYAASVIGMFIFTFTLDSGHISIVYFSSILLGFFMAGYLPVGFEFASEVTYPEPEGTTSGILNACVQIENVRTNILLKHKLMKIIYCIFSNKLFSIY
ncbi:unnamed protein product [Leptidea sinapis]|uniref:Major facilitator superfamily (MFS) profile domain-containing protein n=1 Tax=Leptidea sinapis TaxID=189913 RepID=A0A5E4QW73_9NEOP|nr:unnamed protein product [Leptidea sinapis]